MVEPPPKRIRLRKSGDAAGEIQDMNVKSNFSVDDIENGNEVDVLKHSEFTDDMVYEVRVHGPSSTGSQAL
eukprot:6477105-Amphidinium_carterae.1